MRAQKIQLFDVVVGIEQRAALGGAGLMIKPERRALVLRVKRAGAQQIDQSREHRAERAALQPGALCQGNDRSLRGIRCKRAKGRRRRVVVGLQAVTSDAAKAAHA